MSASALLAAAAVALAGPVPGSLDELPADQYPTEGLAGVKVISTPLDVQCSADPSIVVGVRFTRAARRVRFARAERRSVDGRLLHPGPRFERSSTWRFKRLSLPRCGTRYEVSYAFFRRGDRRGQRLGNFVCVLGADGQPCADRPDSSDG